MPLQRRVPKLKGFTNPNRVTWAVVNVGALAMAFEVGMEVTPAVLRERGMVRGGAPAKVLGGCQLDKALTIRQHVVAGAARGQPEQAGGSVERLSLQS